jgi:hypothetical protein
MSLRLTTIGLLAFAAAAPLTIASAHAETGAALLVDVSGSPQPSLTPYSEVAPGQTLALGSDTTIKFVHYQSCKEVTVTGGSLKINGPDYQLTGGKIVSEVQQACPQQVKIAQTTAVAGGLVMRGVLKLTEVTSHPAFVIVGSKADTITTARFVDEATQETMTLPVQNRHVAWAQGAPALKAGSSYKMTLLANETAQLTVPVRAVADDQANALIIRAD